MVSAGRADGLSDAAVRALLARTRRVAVVGLSARPERPSRRVAEFLAGVGYAVTGVNPGLAGGSVSGIGVVGALVEAGELELVDVFRRREEIPAVVDEAIRLGARAVWMQLGLVEEEAARRARIAGLEVVMDRCPAIEWPRLGMNASITKA